MVARTDFWRFPVFPCKTNGKPTFPSLCNDATELACVAAQALLTEASPVLPEAKALAKNNAINQKQAGNLSVTALI